MPKLSIITICFNEKESIEKTVQSVINQNFKLFEWIIIDGGSTDGTIEILDKYRKYFKHFVSETDTGIYNAMNKAIDIASGEYLYFLNGGDYLFDAEILTKVFENKHNSDFLYGDISVMKSRNSEILKMPANLTIRFLFVKTIPHQSTFTKKELFARFGKYNENYRIAADYDFSLCALLQNKCSYKYLNFCVAHCAPNGLSADDKKREAEKNKIRKKHFGYLRYFCYKLRNNSLIDKYLYFVCNPIFTLRHLKQKLFRKV